MKRRILLLGALATVGCAAMYPTPPAPRPLDGSSIPRLDRVDDGVYRGGQPSPEEMRALVGRYGIKTVVKLDSTVEGRDVVPDGVRLVYAPLPTFSETTEAEVKRVLDEIDRGPKPVFVHCRHGEDRTGLIIALYRVRHGAKVEEAYGDMLMHGFHPYRGVWRTFLREVGWKEAR